MADFIDALGIDAEKRIRAYNAEVLTLISNIGKANAAPIGGNSPSGSDAAIKNISAQYIKQQEALAKMQIQLEKYAQAQATTSIKNLQLKDKELVALAKEEAAIYKQLAAEDRAAAKKAANAEKERLTLEKKTAADQKAADMAIRNAQRKEAAEAKAYAKFEKDFAKYEVSLEKEGNTYNKIQAKINALIPEYQNLATKRELGAKLTTAEANRVDFLTGKLTGYQNILKKVDADMGRHTREVGNYAKANSNLSNSIGQISRELPNFGQSFSIGVLSLTNNVGALIDSVKQVKAQNKELAAQGQQTKGVLSQVLGALFSWQTALFIGIGIFSAYSKEIGEWVSELWNGKRVLDELYKSQNDFNDARLKSSGRTKQEIENIQEYIKIAKNADGAFSTEQQLAAFQKIRPLAKGYFDDLKDGELTTAKGTIALEKFTKALEAQGRAQDLLTSNQGTKDRINQLQAEADSRKKYFDDQKKIILALENRTITEKEFARQKKILDDSEDYRRKIRKEKDDALLAGGQEGKFAVGTGNFTAKFEDTKDIQTALVKLRDEEKKQRKEINKELDASVVLEGKLLAGSKQKAVVDRSAEAESGAKLRFLKAYNEALESSDEERKSLLEGEINDLNKIAVNEKENFFKRLEAYGEMQQKKAELAAMSNDAEMLRISNQTDLELAEAEKAEQRELRQAAKNAEARNTITKYYEAERAAILLKSDKQRQIQAEKSKQEYIKIAEDTAKAELDIIHKRDEILLSTEKIYRDQQMDLFKKVADNEKLTVNIRQEAFRTYIALKQKQIDIDKAAAIAAAGNNQEEIDNIRAKYAVVQELLNTEKENASPFAKSLEHANAELEKIKANLTDKAFSGAGLSSLKQFFDGTFKSVMDGFDLIEDENERFLKKFQYTFEAAASIVSDAMSFIESSQSAQYENQLNRLEKQKDIALAFSNQTAEGRAEIERQYDERQRQIKRKQAAQEKKFAEFQIVVNTARAVVAALPNVILAAVVGAIGIAQLAYVASQPLPEFYKGTDNAPGGYAWTQEKGRELITDKSGRIKSTGSDKGAALTKLDKGDKVYTAEQTAAILFNKQLDSMLFNNGIGGLAETFASTNFKGNTQPQIDYDRLGKAVGDNIPVGDSITIQEDELGRQIFMRKANQKIELTNNRKRVSGTTFSNKRP